MVLLQSPRSRPRRRPVDPAQALRRAQADAQRRAARERAVPHGSGGGFADLGDVLQAHHPAGTVR